MNRHRWATLRVAVGLAGLGALSGCVVVKPPVQAETLEALVSRHNANAAEAPRLWARARMRAVFEDARGRTFALGSTLPVASPNGRLLLEKGDGAGSPNFVLIGNESSQEIFRLGTDVSAGVYYLWAKYGDQGQAWVGHTALAGAPGVQDIPFDPTQLVELLGITPLPAEQTGLPAVVMTLQTDPPFAYRVAYVSRQPMTGRLKLWREVFFGWEQDRQGRLLPARPFHVRLYDGLGRMRVMADLKAYETIQGTSAQMPTDVRVLWPEIKDDGSGLVLQRRAELHLVLSSLSTQSVAPAVFDMKRSLPAGVPVKIVDPAGAGEDTVPTP